MLPLCPLVLPRAPSYSISAPLCSLVLPFCSPVLPLRSLLLPPCFPLLPRYSPRAFGTPSTAAVLPLPIEKNHCQAKHILFSLSNLVDMASRNPPFNRCQELFALQTTRPHIGGAHQPYLAASSNALVPQNTTQANPTLSTISPLVLLLLSYRKIQGLQPLYQSQINSMC